MPPPRPNIEEVGPDWDRTPYGFRRQLLLAALASVPEADVWFDRYWKDLPADLCIKLTRLWESGQRSIDRSRNT